MSAPIFETRPTLAETPGQPPAATVSASTRLIRLDPGWFSLSLLPGAPDRVPGLPAARVCLPPGPPGRRETVTISTARGDGWMTISDEPTMLRVSQAGGEILVTEYWSAGDPAATAPPLRLVRLNPEATAPGTLPAAPIPQPHIPAVPHGPLGGLSPAPAAEILAHVEGVGDVDGKFGDWVGMRGSGRAIEGFSLNPRQGFSTEEFDIRAVLGRDWFSPWLPGSSFCGSRGLALPLRGFCLRLRGAAAARLELACFARFVDGSEIGPMGSDQICAAPSLAALEAFRILPRPRMP